MSPLSSLPSKLAVAALLAGSALLFGPTPAALLGAAGAAALALALPLRPARAAIGAASLLTLAALWGAPGGRALAGLLPPLTALPVIGGVSALAGVGVVYALRPHTPPAPPLLHPRRALAALLLAHLAALGWALLRVRLDPSLSTALLTGAAALLTAWPLPGRGARGVAGALGGSGAVALLLLGHLRAGALVAYAPWAGSAALVAYGACVGLLASSLQSLSSPLGLSLGSFAAIFALPLLPSALQAPASLSLATAWRDAPSWERVARIRQEALPLAAQLDASGSGVAVWKPKEGLMVERDGALLDTNGRAATAERFGAWLGACLTPTRARARLIGDELGTALSGIAELGFVQIDVEGASSEGLRALAGQIDPLRRLLLRPQVRILSRPAAWALAVGQPVDLVVLPLRAPWGSGGQPPMTAATLRALRAGLTPHGVAAIPVSLRAMDTPLLLGLLDDFQATFPGGTAWVSPAGTDSLVLLGHDGPLSWSGLEQCFSVDPAAPRSLSLRAPLDAAALLTWAPPALDGPRAPALSFGLPAAIRDPLEALPPQLGEAALPLAQIWGPGAPLDDLTARAAHRADRLALLETATRSMPDAIEAARKLSLEGGADDALEPLLRPHLEKARAAMARAGQEGPASPAWNEAAAAIDTARLLSPKNAEARCLLGQLGASRGQWGHAEDAFVACTSADPSRLDGWLGLARVRRQRGDLVGAEQALQQAVTARPDSWEAAHNLGVLRVEAGRLEEAKPLLQQALTLSVQGGKEELAPHLALAQLFLRDGKAAPALAEAQRAATLAPAAAEPYYFRGAARYELGQLDEAETDFLRALDIDPAHIGARGGLGQVKASRGEYEAAAAAFRAVLEVDPQNPAAKENLDRVLRALQQE